MLDKLLGSYRPNLRSKKWWWNLFSNGLNMAVVAAWRLHCNLHGKEADSHLEFRRSIAVAAMKHGMEQYRCKKGGKTSKLLQAITVEHFLEPCPSGQGRCQSCSKNTRKWCKLCEKRLHEACFSKFHKA